MAKKPNSCLWYNEPWRVQHNLVVLKHSCTYDTCHYFNATVHIFQSAPTPPPPPCCCHRCRNPSIINSNSEQRRHSLGYDRATQGVTEACAQQQSLRDDIEQAEVLIHIHNISRNRSEGCGREPLFPTPWGKPPTPQELPLPFCGGGVCVHCSSNHFSLPASCAKLLIHTYYVLTYSYAQNINWIFEMMIRYVWVS